MLLYHVLHERNFEACYELPEHLLALCVHYVVSDVLGERIAPYPLVYWLLVLPSLLSGNCFQEREDNMIGDVHRQVSHLTPEARRNSSFDHLGSQCHIGNHGRSLLEERLMFVVEVGANVCKEHHFVHELLHLQPRRRGSLPELLHGHLRQYLADTLDELLSGEPLEEVFHFALGSLRSLGLRGALPSLLLPFTTLFRL